jgi:hypothetical protein
MKKDEESLLRMNFLLQAARLYAETHPSLSSHFLYDFVQMSEKKIIRMYSLPHAVTRPSRPRLTSGGSSSGRSNT